MQAAKKSTPSLDLSRLCPAQGCISGVAWTGDGPAGVCTVCEGHGRVSLSTWMRFTLQNPLIRRD